jgi:hypothetical protein
MDGDPVYRVTLEVREQPVERDGCGQLDRIRFRRRTLRRLAEEFGDRLEVRWEQPDPADSTSPVLLVDGEPVHSGGYLPWEVLRPIIGYALALRLGVGELIDEAAAEVRRLDLGGVEWQEGFLAWLTAEEGGDGAEETPE